MFKITPAKRMPDVLCIDIENIYKDHRGSFFESYRHDEFSKYDIPTFVQENTSYSEYGVMRGLHYQLNPKAQGKLVECISGYIVDIVVDIRRNSKTYGEYEEFFLFSDINSMIYIPPGFAHGFLATSESELACVRYKVTEYYSPEHERIIRWNDPDINIKWENELIDPLDVRLSDKDKAAPLLKDAENNF